MTASIAEKNLVHFEVRDGMRRISCAISNDTLDAAVGLKDVGTPADRRRSFERFRSMIHVAALLRWKAQPLGSVAPVILTDRDLCDVPPKIGNPRFGSLGARA